MKRNNRKTKFGSTNNLDRHKRSQLHYAAQENDAAVTRDLLAQGLDVNGQDSDGWTPLHFAAQANSVEAARVLVGHGAKVDVQDSFGTSPLHVAVFNYDGKSEMVQLLRAAGADPLRVNNSGVSPVQLARMIANTRVRELFDDLK
ncbi:MAG: ankyrin repeat domain-containing protein [Myxococcota bacterium]